MNSLARPVDTAMLAQRAEKRYIRNQWISEIKQISDGFDSDIPLYLTLPGAEGIEIRLLIEEGIIGLTEVNSIREADIGKIIAVENNNEAVLSLQKKFPGLKICQVDFGALIRGPQLFTWPERRSQDWRACRSKIVNLDLNGNLLTTESGDQIVFIIPRWIEKLCEIHGAHPSIDWTLFLTLRGEILWEDRINKFIQNFLMDNIRREPEFRTRCLDYWGSVLYERIILEESDYKRFDRDEQQMILIVLIPKLITNYVCNRGWRVITRRGIKYGGDSTSPMVSFIISFEFETDALEPNRIYCESILDIFTELGSIDIAGNYNEYN
jgi:hypothetical protein